MTFKTLMSLLSSVDLCSLILSSLLYTLFCCFLFSSTCILSCLFILSPLISRIYAFSMSFIFFLSLFTFLLFYLYWSISYFLFSTISLLSLSISWLLYSCCITPSTQLFNLLHSLPFFTFLTLISSHLNLYLFFSHEHLFSFCSTLLISPLLCSYIHVISSLFLVSLLLPSPSF